MSEIRLYITTTEKRADIALSLMTDAFEEEGYAIATMEIDEKKDIWEASVYMFREDEAEIHGRFAALLAEAFPDAPIEREELPDIDWIAKSLEGLKPVRAARFVVHGSHDRGKVRAGEIAIEIDAGQAFGTGHHGTTAGCLEMLTDVLRRERPRNALDLGTGSAVLAIALAKLAGIPVLGTDIDPVATKVARENVRLNGVVRLVHAVTAAGFHNPAFALNAPFDLIVANILARPLMKLAPEMARHLTPGGSLVLSGILDRQRDAVVAAYVGQRFRHVRTTHREGWVTIHLKR